MSDQDGRGAFIGEFLMSFFRAAPEIQDEIMAAAIKWLAINPKELIDPYPVLSHLHALLQKREQ